MLFGLIYHQDQARRNIFKSTGVKTYVVDQTFCPLNEIGYRYFNPISTKGG